MTVEIKDILLKAAEDVQQGMWCTVSWFQLGREDYDAKQLFSGQLTADQALKAERCAEGSLALATFLLGGTESDFIEARRIIEKALPICGPSGCLRSGRPNSPVELFHFNDAHLPDDPFEAGQQLAELFRTTSETL